MDEYVRTGIASLEFTRINHKKEPAVTHGQRVDIENK